MGEYQDRFVLVQVILPLEAGPSPTVASVAGTLDLSLEEIDQNFGVALINPERRQFAMRLTPVGLSRARDVLGDAIDGPFEDPPIGPFDD